MKTHITCILLVCLNSFISYNQVINGYAEVTSAAADVLTIGTVNETFDSFEDGEYVVLMQMQDNTLGNVSNTAAFGNMGSINNTGHYEIRQIRSHTETAGNPTTITLYTVPNYTYNTCANCRVQVITFPQLGNPDYTTTGNMSALDWNGTLGGVLAFYTPGTLTLNHNLSADLNGFRGAGPNAGGSAGCSGGGNYRVTTQQNFADKGESIHRNTNANYAAGMGKILNGGGGGNSHNGGGGGGGNFTSGGDAGPGWPTCSPSAGGLGGLSLQAQITVNRIFMGGGGGAGEGNNNLSTDGGDGGGIILIKAAEIETDACAGVSITANGENISFAGNDGGGGGGAGGTIVFEVYSWNITGGCPLLISANGGDGGDVNNGATHGGGGGGGQGAVFFSTVAPSSNVTVETDNGQGGCDNSGCTSQAGSGGGADGDGVQESVTGPLPINLISFAGYFDVDRVQLEWITSSETDNDYFIVERSGNGTEWTKLKQINGAGNSSSPILYETYDPAPLPGKNYYRLSQVDFDGTKEINGTILVSLKEVHLTLFPNPANDYVNIPHHETGTIQCEVYNSMGQQVPVKYKNENGIIRLEITHLPEGIYTVQISSAYFIETLKFVKKN